MKRIVIVAAAIVVANAAMAAIAPHAVAGPHGVGSAPLVRKNVAELTAKERRAFVRAVHLLKKTPSPYDARFNYYDQFVDWHLSLYRCAGIDMDPTVGHGGSFFLPWHRVFVRLFERALSDVSGHPIAVPYWDWSAPNSATHVFRDDFMGGNGDSTQQYAVTTGPFRKGAWQVTLAPENQPWVASYKPYLVRRLGAGESPAPGGGVLYPLPPVSDVQWALSAPAYDAAPFDMSADPNQSFRNAVEGWWRARPDGTRYADPIDLDDAAAANDPMRGDRARHERDALLDELGRAVGLSGRDRTPTADSERARLNVTKAVKRALSELSAVHPALASHLEATVRTGLFCLYSPHPRHAPRWRT